MDISKEMIERIDQEGMWQKLCSFPRHWKESMEITQEVEWDIDKSRIRSVCFAGMGGSSIGADLVRAYTVNSCPVPVSVIRDYEIPGWVDDHTLFIACSFSGNTEETLSTLETAKERGAQLFAVTSGGRLLVEASREGFGYIKVPGGFPYRAALGYTFVPLFRLFQFLGYTPEGEEALDETAELLEEQVELYSNTDENRALSLARELMDTLPIIYAGSELTDPVAWRWRTQMEENAKTLSYGNRFPEMTHNEIVGWDQITHLTGRLAVFMLQDKEDNPRVTQRMKIVRDLIEDQTVFITRVGSTGYSRLARQFSLVQLGDWVSVYRALLEGVDPTPIAKIDLLKNRLAEL
ncbi:MAG: bifunctional phosphoglucose/phosphomannose isomerase [Balneolaceae bacterium]